MNDEKVKPFFDLALGKRPEFEMFNIKGDPFCLNNLIGNVDFSEMEKELKSALLEELKKSEDPRIVGPDKEVFDSYIRYSSMREFPKPEGVE